MTAKNSGMNLVIEFAPGYIDELVANRLAYAGLMLPPEHGYLVSSITKAGVSTLRTDDGQPVLDVPVRVAGETAAGPLDPYERTATFTITAAARETNVGVELRYRDGSSAEEHLDEAMRGTRLTWSFAFDFLTVLGTSVRPETAEVKIADGALAIGVGAEGGEDTDAHAFRSAFHTNFLGPLDQLSMCIERRLMEIIMQAVVEDLVSRDSNPDADGTVNEDFHAHAGWFNWWAEDREHHYRVRITLHGLYYYEDYDSDYACEVRAYGSFFVSDNGEDVSRLRARFSANIDLDADLIDMEVAEEDYNDAYLNDAFHNHFEHHPEEREDHPFTTFDEWSPIAHFPMAPEEWGSHPRASAALEHTADDLTLHFAATVREVSGSGGIAVGTDELRMDLSRRYIGATDWPMGNPPGPSFSDEGADWVSIPVENTGSLPLSLAASVVPDSQFTVRCPGILEAGETGSIRVKFLTDHLPLWYDPEVIEEEFTGTVTISHNALGTGSFQVEVHVHVRYELEPGPRSPLSDAAGAALSGYADVMLFKRMFAELRMGFAGIDRPGCEEIFTMSVLDARDQYELIARSESDEMAAACRQPAMVKEVELVVPPGATLSYEVRLQDGQRTVARPPYFWRLRSTIRERAGSYQAGRLHDYAAIERGVCLAGPQGLSVLETVDPFRPVEAAHLMDMGSVAALASYGNRVFAASETGLFVVDLTDCEQPRLFQMEERSKGIRFLGRAGRTLWAAGDQSITRLEISANGQLKAHSSIELEFPPLGLAALPGQVVLLDEKGLKLFAGSPGSLVRAGCHEMWDASDLSLAAGENLVTLTSASRGTCLLAVQAGKLAEVGRYAAPFWRAGLEIDRRRMVAYGSSAKGDCLEISLLHVNRVRETRGNYPWHAQIPGSRGPG
jgi:hypothetical protein